MTRKTLNFLLDFRIFLIVQMSITSIANKIFLSCKKYFEADAV